jgi:mannose-6-phosphate isomerase-like protein (cupin superfamily)
MREDETYFVLSGELDVIVGGKFFTLRLGDTLIAPRDIPTSYVIPARPRITI